nr:hypothetical protein [Eubacterium sp.]
MKAKIIACIVIIALAVSLNTVGLVQAKTYKQNKTYTFKGKIEKIKFHHPNGSTITNYVIKLKKPIKVKYDGGKTKVKYMDIFTSSNKKLKKVKKKYNKKVKIKGQIFQAQTAWYAFEFA